MAVAALLACSALPAQENTPATSGGSASSTEALQKATQNPVANLISVPLQDNMNFGVSLLAA